MSFRWILLALLFFGYVAAPLLYFLPYLPSGDSRISVILDLLRPDRFLEYIAGQSLTLSISALLSYQFLRRGAVLTAIALFVPLVAVHILVSSAMMFIGQYNQAVIGCQAVIAVAISAFVLASNIRRESNEVTP